MSSPPERMFRSSEEATYGQRSWSVDESEDSWVEPDFVLENYSCLPGKLLARVGPAGRGALKQVWTRTLQVVLVFQILLMSYYLTASIARVYVDERLVSGYSLAVCHGFCTGVVNGTEWFFENEALDGFPTVQGGMPGMNIGQRANVSCLHEPGTYFVQEPGSRLASGSSRTRETADGQISTDHPMDFCTCIDPVRRYGCSYCICRCLFPRRAVQPAPGSHHVPQGEEESD